ncbi:flavodoxin domain-containing protein [Frankia sp. AvcI1]|uniref:flavodoxin domain-containing protein n=1 Tax=Frankia sp. AvcI1 TaxID=573496 RepID=UPI002117EC0E|nr:flavodoxin domain-containing protein [Frankia sp. AvcI1]
MTRALVAFGTGCGGAGDLAAMIGAALSARGLDADVMPARQVREVASYDAVIVAGALFAGRWACDARRLVRRRRAGLSRLPVWLVSSDPRADAAVTWPGSHGGPSGPAEWGAPAGSQGAGARLGGAEAVGPQPAAQVAELATLIGARGMVTFDGPHRSGRAAQPAAAAARAAAGNRHRPAQLAAFADAVIAAAPPRVLRAVPAWGPGSGEVGAGRRNHRSARMRLVGAAPRPRPSSDALQGSADDADYWVTG